MLERKCIQDMASTTPLEFLAERETLTTTHITKYCSDSVSSAYAYGPIVLVNIGLKVNKTIPANDDDCVNNCQILKVERKARYGSRGVILSQYVGYPYYIQINSNSDIIFVRTFNQAVVPNSTVKYEWLWGQLTYISVYP